MPISTARRTQRIDLRATPRQEALIQQAASQTDRSVSEFLLSSATLEAERVLADRRWFSVSSQQFDAIEAVLGAPLEETSRFARLLARLAVDERAQRHGIGAALLKDAIERCYTLSREVGAAALVVHCRDEQARSFYLTNGDFLPSPANKLHLLLSMKQVTRTLNDS